MGLHTHKVAWWLPTVHNDQENQNKKKMPMSTACWRGLLFKEKYRVKYGSGKDTAGGIAQRHFFFRRLKSKKIRLIPTDQCINYQYYSTQFRPKEL